MHDDQWARLRILMEHMSVIVTMIHVSGLTGSVICASLSRYGES